MKTILSILIAFSLLATARAADLTVEWDDPDNAPGTVAGYGIHIKTGSGEWQQTATATLLHHDIAALAPGTYSIRVTAIDASGLQSDPSESITFTVPKRTGKPRIKITIVIKP